MLRIYYLLYGNIVLLHEALNTSYFNGKNFSQKNKLSLMYKSSRLVGKSTFKKKPITLFLEELNNKYHQRKGE